MLFSVSLINAFYFWVFLLMISILAVTEAYQARYSAGWLIMKACFSFSYLGYSRSSWRAKQPLFPTETRPKHSEGPCFNEFDSRLVLLKSSSSNYLANNGTWEEEIEGGKTASRSPTSHPHAICSQNLCFIIIIVVVTVTGLCFTSSSSSSSLLLLLFSDFGMKRCSGERKFYSYVHLIIHSQAS